jgi:hypothetical protein
MPLAKRLKFSRWVGRPIDSSIFDRLSYLPVARFVSLAREESELDTRAQLEDQNPEPEQVLADAAAICGTNILLLYTLAWPPGFYSQGRGTSGELRRDGRLFEEGRIDLLSIADNIHFWRDRVRPADVKAVVVVNTAPPDRPRNARARQKPMQEDGTVNLHVFESNDFTLVSSAEMAAEIGGRFLAKDPYTIDLSVVASIVRSGPVAIRRLMH